MLSELQLEQLSDRLAYLYQQYEQEMIADIARRIKKTGRYTETAELMARSMMEQGIAPDKIRVEVMRTIRADKVLQDEIAKNTLEWKKAVKKEIEEMENAARAEGNSIIANAGDMSFNDDLGLWEKGGKKLTRSSAINRLLEEMAASTGGALDNITGSMGFRLGHGYASIANAYRLSLDKALLKLATGTFSYDRAVNDCVRELARSGLRTVDYANGRSYQLDTAARMCIRTACHQLSAKMMMSECTELEQDLVEVSSHWGARPEHAAWQGKVYSRSGKNKKYPDFAECHYLEVTGLCGVNCRHTFYPFFDGISEPMEWDKEPEPREYNGKTYTYYDMTQRQRQLERDIRAAKREEAALNAIGEDTTEVVAKRKRLSKEYHQFSRDMGIRAKDNRLRVTMP